MRANWILALAKQISEITLPELDQLAVPGPSVIYGSSTIYKYTHLRSENSQKYLIVIGSFFDW